MVEKSGAVRRRKNLPESVSCHECGGSFDFLPTHLRQQHQMTASGYRNQFGLASNEPLHTIGYAEKMRFHAAKPEQLDQSRNLPMSWNKSYKRTREVLAEMGYFVPSIASKKTGIPRTTLYRAMDIGDLDYAEASPLIYFSNGDDLRVIGLREVIKLISLRDLQEYSRKRQFKRLF